MTLRERIYFNKDLRMKIERIVLSITFLSLYILIANIATWITNNLITLLKGN